MASPLAPKRQLTSPPTACKTPRRDRVASPPLTVHTCMANLEKKLVDPGQGFGVAVETVNPRQEYLDLAVNVLEQVVNGSSQSDMRILLMCDVSASMMPTERGKTPREASGESGAKALGTMLKKLPEMLVSKIPARQRVDCRVAIGFFASTAGWLGYDTYTPRQQGSTHGQVVPGAVPDELPTDERPFWTIHNQYGMGLTFGQPFLAVGSDRFAELCNRAGDAVLDLPRDRAGSTNYEAVLHFADQAFQCNVTSEDHFPLDKLESCHLIIATDGQPQMGLCYPKDLKALSEDLAMRRSVRHALPGNCGTSCTHVSVNWILMGNDTNPELAQEVGGPKTVIGYCADTSDAQLEAGFMGTFGALFDNRGTLTVEVRSDFRSRAELPDSGVSPDAAKMIFDTDLYDEKATYSLGLLRGNNYTARWRHALPEWVVVYDEDGELDAQQRALRDWRLSLSEEERWKDAVLFLRAALVLEDGCRIDLGTKALDVLPHTSSSYWGTHVYGRQARAANRRHRRRFDRPVRPDTSMKKPDAVYAYVEATENALDETARKVTNCATLEDSATMAAVLREESERVGLPRVARWMELHRDRSQREASGASCSSTLRRESSTPHYCAALLSQTPSELEDTTPLPRPEDEEEKEEQEHENPVRISDRLSQEALPRSSVPDQLTYIPSNPISTTAATSPAPTA